MSRVRLIGLIGLGLLFAALWGTAFYFKVDRDRIQSKFDALTQQAATVLVALRTATDNPKADWENAAGQIVALGQSNRDLKQTLSDQNMRIDDMAREAVRLRARGAQLKEIADRAEAQRRAALNRLSDIAITPGTRTDCMALLREAEDALDLVKEAGL